MSIPWPVLLSLPPSLSFSFIAFACLSELGQGLHRLNFAFTSFCETRYYLSTALRSPRETQSALFHFLFVRSFLQRNRVLRARQETFANRREDPRVDSGAFRNGTRRRSRLLLLKALERFCDGKCSALRASDTSRRRVSRRRTLEKLAIRMQIYTSCCSTVAIARGKRVRRTLGGNRARDCK